MPSLASRATIFVQRIFPIAALLLALVAVPVLVFAPSGLPRLEALQAERAQLQAEISKLSNRIGELRAEVDRIKNEPSAVERAARDELGLVRRSEVVFQFDR